MNNKSSKNLFSFNLTFDDIVGKVVGTPAAIIISDPAHAVAPAAVVSPLVATDDSNAVALSAAKNDDKAVAEDVKTPLDFSAATVVATANPAAAPEHPVVVSEAKQAAAPENPAFVAANLVVKAPKNEVVKEVKKVKVVPKAAPKKEEVKEASDPDMGFGDMFD